MGPISKEHMEKVAWIIIWSLHVLYNWLIYQKIMFSLEKGPAQKCYMENSFWIFQHLNAGRNAPCNFIGWLKVNGPFCGHNIWTLGYDTHACKQFVGLFVCLFAFSWKSQCYFVFCICLVSLISNIQMKTCCWCFGSFFYRPRPWYSMLECIYMVLCWIWHKIVYVFTPSSDN